mmetsp:Transcript_96969/g.230636  ORF Transcript_96969/g.230636 Transcript_96969/m.230636 type:complete len:315 (-) Transcript_96969:556-1500(-)
MDDGSCAAVQKRQSARHRGAPGKANIERRLKVVPAALLALVSHVILHISSLHVFCEEEGGLVQAGTQEKDQVRVTQRGQCPHLVHQLVSGDRFRGAVLFPNVETRRLYILHRLRHNLEAPPVCDIDGTLDRGGEALLKGHLARGDQPMLGSGHRLEDLQVRAIGGIIVQHVGPRLHQQLQHFRLVVVERLIHRRPSKGITRVVAGLGIEEHPHHLCVAVADRHVQRRAAVVVRGGRVRAASEELLQLRNPAGGSCRTKHRSRLHGVLLPAEIAVGSYGWCVVLQKLNDLLVAGPGRLVQGCVAPTVHAFGIGAL